MIAAALVAVHLPAALLLGPMLAGVIFGVNGATVRPASYFNLGAQAIIGCLIATVITSSILMAFSRHWLLFLGIMSATLVSSSLLGLVLSRTRGMPGTTAIWGVTPGAATAMVLMAESFGADARLVAFMQYLRVVCVALAAALISRFWLHATNAPLPEIVWFPQLNWIAFGVTIFIAGTCAWLGEWLRVPAGALLLPTFVVMALQLSGVVSVVLPQWLLAITYAFIGWRIGLGFTADAVRHALRALLPILVSIAGLMLICAGFAWLLMELTGVDALTAYLATSPGGMDSVAIIAASSHVDVSFVMAMQAVRLVLVVAFGPRLARLVASRMVAPH